MPKGVSASYSGTARSAAARKGAATRARMKAARQSAIEQALAGGTPLPAPPMGSQRDRVMTGPQISELIARIRAAARASGLA